MSSEPTKAEQACIDINHHIYDYYKHGLIDTPGVYRRFIEELDDIACTGIPRTEKEKNIMLLEIDGVERLILKDSLCSRERELSGRLSVALTEDYKKLCNKELAIIEKLYRSIEL